MTTGTKSVLFGAHAFWLHGFMVWAAWWKLFGPVWDPRYIVAFFIHDLGYIGRPKMDDEYGEMHPIEAAKVMGWLFDIRDPWGNINQLASFCAGTLGELLNSIFGNCPEGISWFNFTFYHSRFLAKRYGTDYSRLCIADKYSFLLEPRRFYLLRVWLSGELYEYMADAVDPTGKYAGEKRSAGTPKQWHDGVSAYLRKWVDDAMKKYRKYSKHEAFQ